MEIIKCSKCKKEIKDLLFEIKGLNLCNDCYNQYKKNNNML